MLPSGLELCLALQGWTAQTPTVCLRLKKMLCKATDGRKRRSLSKCVSGCARIPQGNSPCGALTAWVSGLSWVLRTGCHLQRGRRGSLTGNCVISAFKICMGTQMREFPATHWGKVVAGEPCWPTWEGSWKQVGILPLRKKDNGYQWARWARSKAGECERGRLALGRPGWLGHSGPGGFFSREKEFELPA